MSFGFSVGDFLAAGRLIKDVIIILRTSARSEHQELILELHGLQRALHQIEHLKAPPEQHISVNSIKVAALMCTHVLDEFAAKLRRFETLMGLQRKGHKIELWKQKLRWGFTMEDEVRNLRAYLAAHVGSLNMRLVTEGLTSTHLAAERSDLNIAELHRVAEGNESSLVKIHHNVEESGAITRCVQSTLGKVASMVSGEILPQLKRLTEQVSKIWQTNTQLIGFLVKMQEAPEPALQYTWFQAPVKFEDALGRVFPIPSEFDWPKVEAIITVHFHGSPGHAKVVAGEYELFDPIDRRQVISKPTFHGLRPGMSITMAFVVGRYTHELEEEKRCPRPGCRASAFRLLDGGSAQCNSCNVCFEDTHTTLPLPCRDDLRDTATDDLDTFQDDYVLGKRKIHIDHCGPSSHPHKKARMESMAYKNIRIVRVPLPATPAVCNVRRIARKCSRSTRPSDAETSLPRSMHLDRAEAVATRDTDFSAAETLLMVSQALGCTFKKPTVPIQSIPSSHEVGLPPSCSVPNAEVPVWSLAQTLQWAPSSASSCYSDPSIEYRCSSAFSGVSWNTPSVFSETFSAEDGLHWARHKLESNEGRGSGPRLVASGPPKRSQKPNNKGLGVRRQGRPRREPVFKHLFTGITKLNTG